jgi:hypothetical protein
VAWDEVEIHHRLVGEIGHGIEPRHFRDQRTAADIDEDPLGAKLVAADLDGVLPGEARVPAKDLRALQSLHPLLDTLARIAHDVVLARLDAFHVDPRLSLHQHTVFPRSPRHVRSVGARHHGFGRGAAVIHAGAAELVLLDHGDFHAGAREPRGERRAGLTGADDEGVEGRHPIIIVGKLNFACPTKPC